MRRTVRPFTAIRSAGTTAPEPPGLSRRQAEPPGLSRRPGKRGGKPRGSPAVLAGLVAACGLIAAIARPGAAMDVVRDGKPVAVIVVDTAETPGSGTGKRTPPAGSKRKRRGQPTDRQAADVLVEWVRKMTGAELPVVDEAPRAKPAILIGAAARRAGLSLEDIESPGHEGLRIRCDGRRVLLAGQNDTATLKAACRLLEQWGCRYFIDHPLGEVYPRTRDLALGKLDITEKPGFLYRRIWGSSWSGTSLWKVWNGAGGPGLSMGHAWGSYVSRDRFDEHPEYFHLVDGRRRSSDWYCTSNPALRKVFADGVIAAIRDGRQHPSISPPDGRGYCQCAACRRQDDPKLIEPSSGHVSVSNRYVDFYRDVARDVARASPESILSFYCYADYTQAPTSGTRLPPNLCAWIAPIRYCRYHRIGHPDCPSRGQLASLIDGWSACARRIAYRTYNYNLAEVCVPYSKISIWKHDIPYLKQKGCIGINLETLTNWQIYAPHIYLSIRLAYDPAADAEKIMDDFYARFYGPKAGPLMKEYWTGIDRAFVELDCHSGSFFALHRVYTPEFLAQCRGLVNRAAAAAKGDETYAARVAMAGEGLKNAEQYAALRAAMNRGDFGGAKRLYDRLLARSEANQKTRLGNHYTVGYLKRFLGRCVEAGAEAVAPPNRLVAVLPDRWRLAYDEADQGARQGYARPELDDSAWREVATYSDTLDAQGLPDRQTVMWYRTRFHVPRKHGKLALFFTEVDGDAAVYVNGKEVGRSQKKRQPFTVDIGTAIRQGENVVAVRCDHSSITELFLGGILCPVLVVQQRN